MKKFFAIAKIDNSFIVSAEDEPALQVQIDQIRDRHPAYYRKLVAPGYYVVEAASIAEAKARKHDHPTFDLPLFKKSSH